MMDSGEPYDLISGYKIELIYNQLGKFRKYIKAKNRILKSTYDSIITVFSLSLEM